MRWRTLSGCSQHVLDVHSRTFADAEQHVIRNPMPPVAMDLPGPRTPPKALGYIGSLDRIKGVQVLLNAAPKLARLGCELRFAGQGRSEADVVAAAGRQASVHFDGLVTGTSKAAFFERCDIGVVPSVWEEPGGPTLAMVEWLAAGRPVLVSRRGGLAEAVDSFPGAIAIDPTAEAVVREIRRLFEPERWSDVVEHIRPFEDIDDRATLG